MSIDMSALEIALGKLWEEQKEDISELHGEMLVSEYLKAAKTTEQPVGSADLEKAAIQTGLNLADCMLENIRLKRELDTKRESGDRTALEKIARAAESNSPDAHYLGNVAREALGLLPLPKKEPLV